MERAPVNLNGILVYPFDSKADFLNSIADEKKILIAINAEKILKNEDKKLIKIINSNIGYPDGVGAVLAVKQKEKFTAKLPGVELWLDIIVKFNGTKSFYFIGGSDKVIDITVNKLKQEYPELKIAGYRNGFLRNEDDRIFLIEDIKNKKPDVVYVAMGSPKQEYLMEELYEKHTALYMGLGGSFDIYSGEKKRAPRLFIDLGLEWLFRLLKEPARVKRQAILVKFLFLLMLKRI